MVLHNVSIYRGERSWSICHLSILTATGRALQRTFLPRPPPAPFAGLVANSDIDPSDTFWNQMPGIAGGRGAVSRRRRRGIQESRSCGCVVGAPCRSCERSGDIPESGRRLQRNGELPFSNGLLAHVMVHEITHVLDHRSDWLRQRRTASRLEFASPISCRQVKQQQELSLLCTPRRRRS
jgi:hypothetical protein